MSRILQFFKAIFRSESRSITASEVVVRDFSRFAASDRVLVRSKKGPKISPPLVEGLHHRGYGTKGEYEHSDIIGKSIHNLIIKTNKDEELLVTQPTFEEYVSLSPRKVTPIYAPYASTIVSLLDIHVSPPGTSAAEEGLSSDDKLHILEAGTGHGSLTLHLARAISGANPTLPEVPLPDLRLLSADRPNIESDARNKASSLQAWASWREQRRAVVHSVEKNVGVRYHAEKLIRSFCSGLYWPHINFHTGGLSQFLARQFEIREQAGKPFGFVSYAALDFPNVHFELGRVSEALVDGGQLVIFCPSVTQVGDCVKYIQQHNISLNLQNVVELGEGVSNGRKWDLRLVAPRFGGTNSANPTPSHLNESSTEIEEEEVVQEATISPAEHPVTKSREQVMVCRPKVGDRVVGGGFVGLWRKARALPSDVSDEVEAHDGESCNHPIGNGRVTTASKQQDTLVSDMVPSFRVTSHETSVAELLQDADSVIARIVSLPPAQTIASEYIQSQVETIHKAANTIVGGRLLKRAHLNPGYTARKHVDLERSPSMLWARSNESSRMIRNIATDLAYHIVKAVLRKFQSASAIDLTEPLVGRAPDQRALLLQYADRMERDLLRRHQERLNRFPTDEKDLRDQFTLFPDMDDFRAWVTDTVSKLSSLARALTVCRINKDMQDPAPVVNASTSVTLDLQQSRTKNVADDATLVDVMGSAQFARYRQLEVIMSDLETPIKLDPFQYSGRYVMNPAPEVSMTLNTARAITNQIGSSFHQIEHLWSLSDDIQVKTHDVANWMPFHQETQARMRLRERHRQLLVRDTSSFSADRKSRISTLETNIRESLRKTEELFSKQVEVVWRIIFRHSLDIQLIRLRQLSSRCGSSQGERDLLQYEMGRMILLYVRIYFPKAASSWLRRPWKLVTLRATQTVLSPTHPAIKYLLGEAAQADRKPQQVAHPQRRGRTPINDQVITGETLKNEYSIPSPFNWSAHAPGSDIVDLTAPTESKQEDPTRDEAAAFSKPDYSLKPKSVAYTPLHVRDGPDPGSGDRLATSVPSVSAISHSHKTASEPSEDVDTDDGNDRVGVDEQMVPPPDTDDPYADVETPASYSHRKVRPRLVRRTSYPTSTIRKRRGTRP